MSAVAPAVLKVNMHMVIGNLESKGALKEEEPLGRAYLFVLFILFSFGRNFGRKTFY